MIVVTDTFQPQSVALELEHDPEELMLLANFLNHHLQGRSLAEISQLDLEALDEDFRHCAELLQTIRQTVAKVNQSNVSAPILVHGISEVLRQPEFSQLKQLQTLLHLIEARQEQLVPVMFNRDGDERTTLIHIGVENPLEPMKTCAMVSANYYKEEVPVGSVGVIGPTRMFYENAIALVEATADYISASLTAQPELA